MSARRLILNAAEVRELAATGAVTVRREVEPQPPSDYTDAITDCNGLTGWYDGGDPETAEWWPEESVIPCPFGKPGDLLWVAEKWTPILSRKPAGYLTDPKWQDRTAFYEADNDRPTWAYQWRSSTQMPRQHSRFTVRVVSVTVEQTGGCWGWVVTCEQVPITTPAIPAAAENAR